MTAWVQPEQLAQYEPYLRMLARIQLRQEYQAKVGISDIVQQSLMRAVQAVDQFRGETEPELRGWLRQILARELAHLQRDLHRDKRDIRREQAIQQRLDQSSMRLEQWLAHRDPTPSRQVAGREHLLRLTTALEQLPEGQREAVRMRYLEELGVSEIAERMNRSVPSVAGLLHRGLQQLREVMETST